MRVDGDPSRMGGWLDAVHAHMRILTLDIEPRTTRSTPPLLGTSPPNPLVRGYFYVAA